MALEWLMEDPPQYVSRGQRILLPVVLLHAVSSRPQLPSLEEILL